MAPWEEPTSSNGNVDTFHEDEKIGVDDSILDHLDEKLTSTINWMNN